MAESDPGGLWTKDVYNGAGELVMEYTTDGAGGTSWADATSVANDNVLEQTEYRLRRQRQPDRDDRQPAVRRTPAARARWRG